MDRRNRRYRGGWAFANGVALAVLLPSLCFAADDAAMAAAKRAVRVRDYAEALRLYRGIAMGGDANAQYQLAAMLETGRGTAPDLQEAFQWYMKAAQQGHPKAQYSLGAMYEQGNGAVQDLNEARSWYGRSADQGYAPARERLARLSMAGVQGQWNPELSAGQALLAAVRKRSVKDIDSALAGNADINTRDDAGRSPILEAVRGGDRDVLARILSRRPDLDAVSKDGETPLILAIYKRNTDLAQILVEAGASVDQQDGRGIRPLMAAAITGDRAVALTLIARGADVAARMPDGTDALALAQSRGDRGIVEAILATRKVQAAPEVSAQARQAAAKKLNDLKSFAPDDDAWTPLMMAAWRGQTDLVRILLTQGAAVNAVSPQGYTALSRAASVGKQDVVGVLLAAGADFRQGPADKLPLVLACGGGHVEAVRQLVKAYGNWRDHREVFVRALDAALRAGKGPVVKELFDAGLTLDMADVPEAASPWFLAASRGDTDVLKICLDRQVAVNGRDAQGRTALMLVAEKGYGPAVELLLEHKADPLLTDKEGYTALALASRTGQDDVVQILLGSGSRADQKSANGNTPLMLAVAGGHTPVVRSLLRAKPRLDEVNAMGEGALAIAVRRNDLAMARVLLDHGANPYLDVAVLRGASAPMQQLLDKYKTVKSWINKVL